MGKWKPNAYQITDYNQILDQVFQFTINHFEILSEIRINQNKYIDVFHQDQEKNRLKQGKSTFKITRNKSLSYKINKLK